MFFLLPEEQKERFSSAGEDRTSRQRLLYWEHGWDMIKAHPITGVGYFNFAKYYNLHFPDDVLYEHAQLPHNIMIQVGTDAGFMGLIPFCSLFIVAIFISRKFAALREEEPFLSMVVLGTGYGVLGFFLAGQFVTVTYYPFLWIGLSFMVAGANIYNNIVSEAVEKKRRELRAANSATPSPLPGPGA